MKFVRVIAALCCLSALVYLGCQKSGFSTDSTPYVAEPTVATISGRVTDESKMPVSGAVVKAGTASDTTDVDGRFTIKSVSIDRKAGAVKVEKEGFFTGIKTIVVNPGKENNVAVQLLKKKIAGSFDAAAGGTVTLPSGGGTVAFPAAGVVNAATNAAYSGKVTTSAYFFDPTAEGFENIIPGALRGLNSASQETGLQSFSMVAVELTGADEQKLQLAQGKTATITFAIPAGLQAQAPATIPLWYLDEATGLWKEEGTATKQGNNYVGTVKHFSYWNCDVPYTLVDFSAVIKTQTRGPLSNAKVTLQSGSSTDTLVVLGSGFTDAEGYTAGKIPAGHVLKMEVSDKCGNVLYSKEIGPFTSKADLGIITVTSNNNMVTFSGTAVDCNDAPIARGYVTITLDGIVNRAAVVNGVFSLTVQSCVNTATSARLVAYDIDAMVGGAETEVAVSGTAVNVGMLKACGGSVDEFFTYTANGVDYNFNVITGSTMYVAVNKPGNDSIATLMINSTSPVNTSIYGTIKAPDMSPGTKQFNTFGLSREGGPDHLMKSLDVNITENGLYLAGTFSGTVTDYSIQGTVTIPATGKFRLKCIR